MVIIPSTIDMSPMNNSYGTYKPTQLTMGHHPVSLSSLRAGPEVTEALRQARQALEEVEALERKKEMNQKVPRRVPSPWA